MAASVQELHGRSLEDASLEKEGYEMLLFTRLTNFKNLVVSSVLVSRVKHKGTLQAPAFRST